jgi:hypothetical protein
LIPTILLSARQIILCEISNGLQVDKKLVRKEKDGIYKKKYPKNERITQNW